MVQMYIYIEKKKTKIKPPMLTERSMPTQAHVDDIKKLPDIYRELDNVYSRMS